MEKHLICTFVSFLWHLKSSPQICLTNTWKHNCFYTTGFTFQFKSPKITPAEIYDTFWNGTKEIHLSWTQLAGPPLVSMLMDCHQILFMYIYQHWWFPGDASLRLWWSLDFSSCATMIWHLGLGMDKPNTSSRECFPCLGGVSWSP